MAIEDADTTNAASDMPIAEGPPSPSERSRSDKRKISALNTHDPAITQLTEQVAEARHREALANTERVVQTMVFEMSRRFNAEEEAASTRMHQMIQGKSLYSERKCTKGF